ncbi:hypothetical protein [Nocardioides ungokensis]|uniref:hypothetical protein n=1 Tax=Nocardioides ungokensis TaxID=1643322 RepID=UPI0015E04C35|nr:hypothetical protein [Nocardioides ungokensis]
MSPTVVLLLGGLLVFGGAALSLSLVGVVTSERRGVARSLAAIEAIDAAPAVLRAEVERPFNERVLAPLGDRLVGIGRRLVRRVPTNGSSTVWTSPGIRLPGT